MSSLNSTSKRSWGVGLRSAAQLVCGAMAVLLLCLPLFSQGNAGRIMGTVTDQSGGVVSGATVTVVDTDRGVTKTLMTNDAGEYNAPNLTPGNYKVRAESKGFKTIERTSIVLEVGKEIRVDLSLSPGSVAETMTITESVPLVETTNATLGGTLNNADINDMPLNGRNYQSLLSLRPGVVLQPGGGPWTQSTNGIRPDESAWMVDGVINSNFSDGRPVIGVSSPITDAATILPIDAIQEFNLMESPKAESGWKPGAVVNVGIKSGTNQLHGSAYAFGRTDSWDARNTFNPVPTNGNCPLGALNQCDKTPAQLKQFGGVAGGAIKKDKLFYFGAYEGVRSFIGNALSTSGIPETISTGSTKNSMVDAIMALQAKGTPVSALSLAFAGCPAGAVTAASTCTGNLFPSNPSNSKGFVATFPNSNQSDNGVGKLDYHINSKNTLNGLLIIGQYTGDGMDHPFIEKIYSDTFLIKTWTMTENWIWTPTSNVVNEMRFGYDRFTLNQINDDAAVKSGINTGLTVPGVPQVNISGFNQVGTQHNRPQITAPNPYFDFQDNVSYLKGKHTFKFGGEFAHIEADNNTPDYGRGRINFKGNRAFVGSTPLEDFFAGYADSGIGFVGSAARKMTWMSYAGFVQDDWRITPKVTLNLGLRYSYTSPIKEANNLFGNFDPQLGFVQQGKQIGTVWKPDYRDFSPRVGIAWDVTGKGTTVVRGGFSLMYSSFVAATFLTQNQFQNSSAVGIGVTPTSATFTCSVPGCPAGAGGTIKSAAFNYNDPQQLCWDPAIPAACAFKTPGQTTVFPGGTGLQCGDGIGSDPAPCSIMAVDPNLRTPYIENFSLGIQHMFGNNLSLEVGYVGNHGARLTGFNDINQPTPGAAFPAGELASCAAGIVPAGLTCTGKDASAVLAQQARPLFSKFPYIGFINMMTNRVRSNYNSLQVTLNKRMSHGVSFIAGYTYAHATDDGSLNRFGLIPQNANNLKPEYGNGDFDVRHRLTLTASYNIPGIKGFAQLLEGWQLNTIVSLQAAQPWLVNDYKSNFSGTFDNSDRWDFTGNRADMKASANTLPFCTGNIDGTGGHCTTFSDITFEESAPLANSATLWGACVKDARNAITVTKAGCYASPTGNAFLTPPALGTFGNMGRNLFRDSGFRNMDFSVFKNFTFKERYGVQFRAEVFNLFNHPIPANPYGSSNGSSNANNDPSNDNTTFGGSGGTPDFVAGNPLVGSGSQRVIQLGLKLKF